MVIDHILSSIEQKSRIKWVGSDWYCREGSISLAKREIIKLIISQIQTQSDYKNIIKALIAHYIDGALSSLLLINTPIFNRWKICTPVLIPNSNHSYKRNQDQSYQW
jgi:hypothetical protein